ncbi:hypothetical protein Cpap_1823 [Ruminiclostridium papyrosolvens DSM 2782]|uniref:Peptidase M50 n=2 Tax=Ruminiclostridium papyrosolvens TaxID=29362 RepID=F1TDJ1_9FIRM|nr:hypothetical protein Cpap_1823 [Ruminiclostridium papyrosolvens DSM 2782]
MKSYMKNDITVIKQDEEVVVVYNRNNRNTYKIGHKEFEILNLLNKANTIDDIYDSNFSKDYIIHLINTFSEVGLINEKSIKKRFRNWKLIDGIEVFKSKKLFIKILYYIILFLPIPLLFIGISLVKFNFNSVVFSFNFINIICALIFALISTLLHEISHGIVAAINNVYVIEIGLKFNHFIPTMYTSLYGMEYINNKRKILVYIAGILSDIGLIGISLILYRAFPSLDNILFLYIFIEILSVISNLCIFMQTDGYKIFKVLLGEDI